MAKRSVPLRALLFDGINPLTRFLIVADTIIYTSAGLLGPIFALFIVEFIDGGSAAVAGAAAGIFLITKSLFQIPAAAIIDKICGEKDDFFILFIGMVIVSLLPLAYLFISTPLELYIVQFLLGIAMAATFPSFMAIFTRHVDKGSEGMTWGVYYTFTDLSSAAAAAIGGFLALTIGFEAVIFIVAAVGLIGTLLYLPAIRHLETCDLE